MPTKSTFNWLTLISALFITCLLVANIIAVKPVALFGFVMPAGIIVFPISYICGDVLTEVYGFHAARRVIWLGFFCNLIAVLAFAAAQALPGAAPIWDAQPAYERILGFTPSILTASFVAYLIGEFANSFVLAKLKLATQGRWLWLRTISSTIVGQGLDSAVFIGLAALFGVFPTAIVLNLVLTQWLFKTLYETLATPITYAVITHLKRVEGLDTYDRTTNFNPLLVTE